MTYVVMCDIGRTLIDRNNKLMHPLVFQKLIQLTENGVDIYMATDGDKGFASKVESRFQYDEPQNANHINIFKDIICRPTIHHPGKSNERFWTGPFEQLKERYAGRDVQFVLLDDMKNIRNMANHFGVNTIDTSEEILDNHIVAQLDCLFPQFAASTPS
jgi:hypothetical protein